MKVVIEREDSAVGQQAVEVQPLIGETILEINSPIITEVLIDSRSEQPPRVVMHPDGSRRLLVASEDRRGKFLRRTQAGA